MKEFTLSQFIGHLAEMQATTVIALHTGLEHVAQTVETTAKAKIGYYQGASGPFSEWEPLAESTEEDKARLGYPADAPLLREGELRESIHHEVEGLEAVVGSASAIAGYQEFGTATIPPRPFIGPAGIESETKIIRTLGAATVVGLCTGGEIPSGLYDFKTALLPK